MPYKSPYIIIIIFLCCCFLFPTNGPAQRSVTDSLRQEIAKAKSDTSRVLLVKELALAMGNENRDSALLLLQGALPLAERSGFKAGQFELWHAMGSIYGSQSKIDSAIIAEEKARQIALESGDKKRLATALRALGMAYNTINKKRKALNLLEQSLQLAVEIRDRSQEAQVLKNMGSVYSYLTVFDTADITFNRVLKLHEESGDKKRQGNILMNLGNNAARSADLDKAIRYYERSLSVWREIGNPGGEALVYRMMGYSCFVLGHLPRALEYYQENLKLVEPLKGKERAIGLESIAEVYLSMEDYPRALEYYEQAAKQWESLGSQIHQSDLKRKKAKVFLLSKDYNTALQLLNQSFHFRKSNSQNIYTSDLHRDIGLCYEHLNQLDSAIIFLQQAVDISTQANNFLIKSQSHIALGRIFHKQNRTDQAIFQLNEAIKAARFSGLEEQEMEATKELSQVYKSQNNYTQAFLHLEHYNMLKDSLFNEKNIKKITRLEANYEFEKEKQQLAFQREKEIEKQRDVQRNMWIALGIALLFIFTIVWYYRSKQKGNAALNRLNKALMEQKAVVEKQKEKLEELDEIKSRFFTNISYEFRTPLTIISGMIDQVKTKPDVWLDKGSNMIKRNVDGLLNLVNQILDLRKLESDEMQVNMIQGDIIYYLHYILESHHSFAQGKEIQLHFLPMQDKLVIDYDPDKLLRIVSNFLSNAIKFTPKKGHIYFHVDHKSENGSEALQIRVQDTGPGIPEDQLAHIFDRFYQVDNSTTWKGEGTGIGLALTKELVHLLKGEITVKSSIGKGTSFTVSLPITRNAVLQDEHEPTALEGSAATTTPDLQPVPEGKGTADISKSSLLLVEDNPDVVQFLISCLEADYQLMVARDGQAGIDLAIEQVPDLIVSDVMMPEKDGFELCDTLKKDERTSHIPIILLTARADMDSRISGLERGADAYLSKPFEQKELLVRLKNLLKLRQKLQKRYRSFEPIESPASPEDMFVQKVRKAVEDKMGDEDFGILHLCRAVALSRAQLHNKIKALTGLSTSHYIRSIRLQKAKQLLNKGELNVSEVAYEVGFKDPKYFSRLFIEAFGIPPSKTRK